MGTTIMTERSRRQVVIISDLHLGGRPPGSRAPDGSALPPFQINYAYAQLVEFIDWIRNDGRDRGCDDLELVINGDIVDFLAEDDDAPGLVWTGDQAKAVKRLEQILARTRGADGRGVAEAL